MAKPKPYGRGRIQFLAVLDAIRTDLAAGLTLRSVHAKHKKIDVTYSAFAKLVSRYASDSRPIGKSNERQTSTGLQHERQHSGTADPTLLRKLTRGG